MNAPSRLTLLAFTGFVSASCVTEPAPVVVAPRPAGTVVVAPVTPRPVVVAPVYRRPVVVAPARPVVVRPRRW